MSQQKQKPQVLIDYAFKLLSYAQRSTYETETHKGQIVTAVMKDRERTKLMAEYNRVKQYLKDKYQIEL